MALLPTLAVAAVARSEPHPNAPPETAQFDFLIGEWKCQTRWMQPDGTLADGPSATWSGRYVLDGWAIQDDWVSPQPDGSLFRGFNIRSFNAQTGQWDTLPSGPNFAPNMAYIGWGVYVMARVDGDAKKKKAAWSAAAHLGGKDISLWCAAYPSGFQPYRNSHFNIPEWTAAGYDEAFIADYHDPDQLTTCCPGPSAVQRCTDALLTGAADLARQQHLPMHIHLAETLSQKVMGPRLYGTSLLKHLETLGVLGPNLSLAHTVWIDMEDIDPIVRSGATSVHNPASNLRLGSGFAPGTPGE